MRKILGRVGVAMLTVTAAATVIVATGHAEPAATPPDAGLLVPRLMKSPADLARGKALFVGTCGAYCHRPSSENAGGDASDAPFLFDCDWRHGGSDAQIFKTISQGVEGTRMVAFGGAIPDEDIWRIIAYLKSASQCSASH